MEIPIQCLTGCVTHEYMGYRYIRGKYSTEHHEIGLKGVGVLEYPLPHHIAGMCRLNDRWCVRSLPLKGWTPNTTRLILAVRAASKSIIEEGT